MKKYIRFRKERSLDKNIETSFYFFRKHFKPMMRILWKYNSVIIVAFLASYFLYYFYYFGAFDGLIDFKGSGNSNSAILKMFSNTQFLLVALVLMLTSFIFFPRFYASIMGYMRVYMENEGEVKDAQVKNYIDEKFWGFIGLVLLAIVLGGIIVGLSAFLFISAAGNSGIIILLALLLFLFFAYVMIPYSISFYVYFFEDKGPIEALSMAFKYVKSRWWYSFGILLVMGIIVGLISAIFQAPLSIYIIVKTVLVGQSGSVADTSSLQGDILGASISVFAIAGGYLVKILTILSTAILYFSIKEYHTQEGILDRIDQIGKEDDPA